MMRYPVLLNSNEIAIKEQQQQPTKYVYDDEEKEFFLWVYSIFVNNWEERTPETQPKIN